MDSAAAWSSLADLLSSFQAIAEDGAVALIKIDGERITQRYTVVVTGPKIRECPFRMDGDNLRELLEEAIAFYADHRS